MNNYLKFSEEVESAFENDRPVVALESTMISFGLPYPENIQTAFQAKRLIEAQGCIPAVIGMIDNKIRVGLSDVEIEKFARSNDVVKVGKRDIPWVISQGLMGATTVSGTLAVCKMTGIKFMATGGIGGVHKEVTESLDISSDLIEISNTDVAVVCSGVKSVLDIPKTIEMLETLGVPVIGYQTDEFPTFISKGSGLNLECSLYTTLEVVNYLKTREGLGVKGGVLIANPVPDKYALNWDYMEKLIEDALEIAKEYEIKGKEITPFLLREIVKDSKGESLKANKALIENNARLAAEIAKQYFE